MHEFGVDHGKLRTPLLQVFMKPLFPIGQTLSLTTSVYFTEYI